MYAVLAVLLWKACALTAFAVVVLCGFCFGGGALHEKPSALPSMYKYAIMRFYVACGKRKKYATSDAYGLFCARARILLVFILWLCYTTYVILSYFQKRRL